MGGGARNELTLECPLAQLSCLFTEKMSRDTTRCLHSTAWPNKGRGWSQVEPGKDQLVLSLVSSSLLGHRAG